MWFLSSIISACNSLSSYFYSIYVEVYGWVYPFYNAAILFYYVSSFFANLAWYFYDFNTWVDNTASKLLEILSWATIQSYITNWLRYISDLGTIFYYFWTNVTNVVTSWWNNTSLLVKGWINDVNT